MPLSESSILQKNQGSIDLAATQTTTATLGSGTTDGSTVFLVTRVSGGGVGLGTPDGFQQDISISLGGAFLQTFRRTDCPVGESSWTIGPLSLSPGLVIWFTYEFAGTDLTEPLEQFVTHGLTSVTSVSTGTTPSTSYTDLMCLAVHCADAVTTISGQTNGFQNTASAGELQSATSGSHGSGTVSVSRLYPSAGGTFECTATFGATVTGMGALLVYRRVGTLVLPPVATGVQVG